MHSLYSNIYRTIRRKK